MEDGIELAIAEAIVLSAYLTANGLSFATIAKLPKGSFAEAMKDPGAERGKAIVVGGKVLQIDKDGDYFKGLLCADRWCNKIYYFITPGTTRGIVGGKWARFAGVVTQKYSYSNTGGGQTHSILLVGYFKGQD